MENITEAQKNERIQSTLENYAEQKASISQTLNFLLLLYIQEVQESGIPTTDEHQNSLQFFHEIVGLL